MKAMILAAGRGERMRPLTDHCPKPVVKVLDKPLIEYHLERLSQAGFKQVVINHAWLGHMLEEHLGDGSRWGLSILYSPEKQALETGGGIVNAMALLTDNGRVIEPFLVINGDIFLDKLPAMSHLQLPEGMMAKLFLVDNPVQHPKGDFELVGQYVREGAPDASKLTFAGMGVYRPDFFNDAPQGAFGTPLLMRREMAKGLVCAEHWQDYWCDVGTPERLQQLEHRLSKTS